jgi:dienelactone hydrolase
VFVTLGSVAAGDRGADVGQVSRAVLDGIPLAWVEPTARREAAPLALWLPYLGATKQDAIPFLRELAGAGFVAVSFDPWQHGERGTESGEQIMSRVLGDFRRYMWPILGQTMLDCLRVIDWAAARLGTGSRVVAGGVSMGGDIAVALGGVDRRVTRVAAIVATPDWTRPGMRVLTDPSRVLDQGHADAYAQWFYDHFDPLSHLGAYADGPAITFECAANDTHVPPDGALRFHAALADAYPDARERVRVNLHPGVDHMDGVRDATMRQNCLTWFLEPSGESDRPGKA